jgi:hypothetical protein
MSIRLRHAMITCRCPNDISFCIWTYQIKIISNNGHIRQTVRILGNPLVNFVSKTYCWRG